MGAFASWILDLKRKPDGSACHVSLAARLCAWRRPSLDPARTIVFSEFNPTAQMLIEWIGALPARIALPLIPFNPVPGVDYSLFVPNANPVDLGHIPGTIDSVASFVPFDDIGGRTIQHWRKLGIRTIWFMRDGRRYGVAPLAGLCGKAMSRLLHRFTGANLDKHRDSPAPVPFRGRAPLGPSRIAGDKLSIVHFIGSLDSGGAERQLCNTAIAQKRAGHDVRVLLEKPPLAHAGHYLPLLQDAGIPTRSIGAYWDDSFPGRWQQAGISLAALPSVPMVLRKQVLDLAGELIMNPPHLLHSWLDWPNIVAFLASQLANIAPIVLSFRNINPENMPHLLEPWMRPWYKVAASIPDVTMLANSTAGARDYEQWLDMPNGKVNVLRNAFVPPVSPDDAAVADFRRQLGLTPDTPVVAGVLRLSPEKRPLFFLEVIARLRLQVPKVQVLLAGHGSMEAQVRADIRRLGLDKVVHLLGRRDDIPTVLSASQVLLLVSLLEGIPNVVLEAQHLGCVPVSTDVGGVRETLLAETSGLLCPRDDANALTDAVAGLLKSPARRAAMSDAGRAFVARQFNPQSIHEQTMALYAAMLTSVSEKERNAA